jgi:hypothetical protein
MYDE